MDEYKHTTPEFTILMQHSKIIYIDSSCIKFIRLVPWILIPHIFNKVSNIMFKCYNQLIYWNLFLASQYIKYHCSDQIFRNTFQSDLKIIIKSLLIKYNQAFKIEQWYQYWAETKVLYINITILHPSVNRLHSILRGKINHAW